MRNKTIVNNPYIIYILEDKKLGKKFKGVAKCSTDDTFDEAKGIQIATLKAEIKRDRYKMHSLISNYNYWEKAMASELKQTENRVNQLEEKIQKKYEEIYVLAN